MRTWRRLWMLPLLLWFTAPAAAATDVGVFVTAPGQSCSARIPNPVVGQSICFEQTTNTLKIYDGAWRVTSAQELGMLSVRDYGAVCNGSTNDASAFSAANTAASVAGKTIIVSPGNCAIGADLTTSANVTYLFLKGAKLLITNGITVTITGPIVAEDYQIFSWTGTGKATMRTPSTLNVMWWGAVADNPDPACHNDGSVWTCDRSGTDNVAALQKLSSGLTSGSRVYIPPAPAGKYYRISGATADNNPLTIVSGITILHLTDIEIFGAGPASRFYMSDFDNSKYDITDRVPAEVYSSWGIFSGINVLGLSQRVSIHDLAFWGEYGTTEKVPVAGKYARAQAVKIYMSSYITVQRVSGSNILGNVVTVSGGSGAAQSKYVDVLDSYASNCAENAFNYGGSTAFGNFRGNTAINSQCLIESAPDNFVITNNTAHWTSDFNHLDKMGHLRSVGISNIGPNALIKDNTITADGYKLAVGINLRNQGHLVLIFNNNFADTTGWTLGAGWSIAGGVAKSSGSQTTDSDLTSTQVTLTKGEMYKVTLTAKIAAGTLKAYFGGTIMNLSAGENTLYYPVAGEKDMIFKLIASENFVGSVENIKVMLIHYDARHSQVTGNTIRGGKVSGITINATADGSSVTNNILQDIGESSAHSNCGICLNGRPYKQLQNVVVTGNTIQGKGLRTGIYLDYVSHAVISHNNVRSARYSILRGPHTVEHITMTFNDLHATDAGEFYDSGAGVATWDIRGNTGRVPGQNPGTPGIRPPVPPPVRP